MSSTQEEISNNLNDIRKVLELILIEMRERNEREESNLQKIQSGQLKA
jgi:hypothetical protein